MAKTYLGIEIGGTKLQIVVGQDGGTIQERRRFQVAKEQGGEGIRRQIQSALPELLAAFDPSAISVGFGGPVDWRLGRITCSHQIVGWSDFPLGDFLGQLSGLPVHVENDANLAALGEATCGAGKGMNPVFYVTLGSGVGGGLVINGRNYHGAVPGEVEIGHVRLDRSGTTVESRCSGWAVDARIRREVASGSKGLLCQLAGQSPGGEARHLGAALQENDPLAQSILQETAQDLAFGLSHAVHLFHPQVIVLGGGLSMLGDPLRQAVAGCLPRFVMQVFHPPPEVRLAVLGEDAVPVGCLVAAAFESGQIRR